jgi:signal transduction histidine kinase
VEIGVTSETGFCVLRFSDNGSGIPADILPRIFDPFYSTKSHGRGTGMGLTFCRRVADALGGTIVCESEPHVRTTFTLRLPEPGTSADRALHDAPAKPRRWPAGQDIAG